MIFKNRVNQYYSGERKKNNIVIKIKKLMKILNVVVDTILKEKLIKKNDYTFWVYKK